MNQTGMRRGGHEVRRVLPGVGLWALLAVAAGGYAALTGRPVLPAIVTLDEWVAAVLFIAPLAAFMLKMARTVEPEDRAGAANRVASAAYRLGCTALVVFLMALATRGIFGLGWKPF